MLRIGPTPYYRTVSASLFAAMRAAWAEVRPRFEAYQLVLPGSPGFVCQPQACTAYCCHAYSVNLGDADVERFRRLEQLVLADFLECDEDGKPLTLPMAQPFLLRREEGRCKFLGGHLGCTVYEGRPNACRLYPHFIVFWDGEAGRARTTPSKRAAASFDAAVLGNIYGLIPLLLGHVQCPGFTGDPVNEAEWHRLFSATYQLQYAAV